MVLDSIFAPQKKRIYALVGESGTGKSYFAQSIAHKYRLDFIIDDGLLIRGNRILAGKSVKEEKTFMAAVKAALFDDKSRRDEVARKLQTEKWRKILLLGTSEKMVNKIAARLQLTAPEKIIRIEDIATPDEIDTALRSRRIEGKHVIPVPSVEIKQHYPQIFYDTIRVLRQKNKKKPGITPLPHPVSMIHEKSVVRPLYSRPSKVVISEWALSQMLKYCIKEYNESIIVKNIAVKDDENGYRLAITADIPFGTQLGGNIGELREHIINDIERYTGILIEEVVIIIDKITEK
jgi:adenylate kinase family enzyme